MSKNPLFREGEENEKVIRNPRADPHHHQKLITSRGSPLGHACQVWLRQLSCLQNDRINDRTIGERAFHTAAPRAWNSSPSDVKKADTVKTFKKRLKTFLFCKHYGNV